MWRMIEASLSVTKLLQEVSEGQRTRKVETSQNTGL